MTSKKKLAFAALVFAAATACTTDPVRVEQDYGNSVRHMIDAQLADPEAARNPAPGLPGALDGDKGETAIEAYRSPPPATGAPREFFRIRR